MENKRDMVLKSQETFSLLSDKFAAYVSEIIKSVKAGEDLRIAVEKQLEPLLRSIGVETESKYERLGKEAKTIYRGRPDAVHGQVIIEYEKPNAFSSDRNISHAHERLIGYMKAEVQGHKIDPIGLLNRLVGVGFDGHSIFFTRYSPQKTEKRAMIYKEAFIRYGPYTFNQESARTFLTYLRSLSRLPLTAENLADRFGPKGKIAPMAVSSLIDSLQNWGDARVHMFFDEWERLFGIVYGEQFNIQQEQRSKSLSRLYKVREETNFQQLLFCVHTYFAFLMKLIAAELVSLGEGTFTSSISCDLVHTTKEELLEILGDMEDGGVYVRRGITNFLEGDFFRWYLDAFSPRLEEAIRETARALSEFEPATAIVAPESTRDLLKKLYQYLVPRKVRHNLGEYYTPDWLAELVISEVGYKGDTRKRLLDPACGSGTFLVLAIQKAREYDAKQKTPPGETVKRIVSNVCGFDLNPLAIIASRTNYLFALGELANELGHLEIPIYLADLVLGPERWGLLTSGRGDGESVVEKFDFIVGNPPWIRWGYLAPEYREATLHLWQNYGLFSLKGYAARLGGGEKDFSMLFTYVCSDHYLKHGGKLGFLITQEVFKSKGAGEGFRKFKLGKNGEALKVTKAHELVAVQPFEGAANKTAMIILKKGQETEYPVPYTVWKRKRGTGKIPTDANLREVKQLLQMKKLWARSIGPPSGAWQTISQGQERLLTLEGDNHYKARVGASADPYGIFWLEIKEVLSGGDLVVRNLTEKGKWKIQPVQERIEADLVFPAVRGSDIKRWSAHPEIYVLVTQDPRRRKGYRETTMKKRWPRTYSYVLRFKKELLNRAAYKKYHAESGNPFYSQFNIADYTFARYKVVWKRMADDIVGAVISQYKTPFGYKIVVPTTTTTLFHLDNKAEAHYLCAIINSTPVREFIKSYSSAGRGFGTPSVMKHIGIPRFNPKEKLHQELAHLSETLHDLTAEGKCDEISRLEKDVDDCTSKLFGIK